jgi:hypothetical protein
MSRPVLDVLLKEDPPELYKRLSETPGDTCIIMTNGEVLNIDKPNIPNNAPHYILTDYYCRAASSLLKLVFDAGNIKNIAYIFIGGEVIDIEYSLHFTFRGGDGREIYIGAHDPHEPESEEDANAILEEEIDGLVDSCDDALSDKELMQALERDGA